MLMSDAPGGGGWGPHQTGADTHRLLGIGKKQNSEESVCLENEGCDLTRGFTLTMTIRLGERRNAGS